MMLMACGRKTGGAVAVVAIAALMVALVAPRTPAADAIVLPFDNSVATRAAVYADAAYADNENELRGWTCTQCLKLPRVMRLITPVSILHSGLFTGIRLFAGFAPDNTLVISVRGSSNAANWFTNLRTTLSTAWAPAERVHTGFLDAYQGFAHDLFHSVIGPVSTNPNIRRVIITGHSLGGAIANIYVAHLLWEAANNRLPSGHFIHRRNVALYLVTFGAPRVGNNEFVTQFHARLQRVPAGIGSWRVVNFRDPVARVPGSFFAFRHIIREIFFDQNGRQRVCHTAVAEDRSCSRSTSFNIALVRYHLHGAYLNLFEPHLNSLFAQARRRRRELGVELEEKCDELTECEATCENKLDQENDDDWQGFVDSIRTLAANLSQPVYSDDEDAVFDEDAIVVHTTDDFFAAIGDTFNTGQVENVTLKLATTGDVPSKCLVCNCPTCSCPGFANKALTAEHKVGVGIGVAVVIVASIVLAVVLHRRSRARRTVQMKDMNQQLLKDEDFDYEL